MGIFAKKITYKTADGVEVSSIAAAIEQHDDDMIFFDVDGVDALILVDGRIEVSSVVAPLDNTLSLTKIDQYHAEFLNKKSSYVSQKEKDSWDRKARIAEKLLENVPLSVLEESYLSSANILDRKAWADKVIGKAVSYSSAEGMADDLRKKQKTAFLDVKTKDERDTLMVGIRDDWTNLGA
jgi:hypothetical protein